MATRTITEDVSTSLLEVFETLAEYGPTEAEPMDIKDLSVELAELPEVLFGILEQLADLSLIDGDTGSYWLLVEADRDNAAEILENAQNAISELREPATRTARKAAAKPTPKHARRAIQPVKAENGETVTVPVSEGSTERRELDATLGERVLSEDNMSDLIRQAKREGKPVTTVAETAGSWINEPGESHLIEWESGMQVTGHVILPADDEIPAPPDGVSTNFWELYKTGLTRPARIFWGSKVAEQIKAHKERKEAAAKVVPSAAPQPTPIDPVTGQPFPF